MPLKKSQNDYEFTKFLNWIHDSIVVHKNGDPCVYMEIGSYAGESLAGVASVLPEGSYLIVVDLADNPEAEASLQKVLIDVQEKYKHVVKAFFGDSNNPSIIFEVKKYLNEIKEKDLRVGHPDLVFIDGNHTFKYAYNDYITWRNHFSFTAFHDIAKEAIVRSSMKHGGIEQACAAHIWLMLTEMIPQYSLGYTPQSTLDSRSFGDEQLWWEFIAPDSYQGIGVVKS
jgi:Methyltransferase domain